MADDRMLELWRTQEAEGFRMTADEVRERSKAMEKKLRRMMWDFYAAFVLVGIVLVAMASLAPTPGQTIGVLLSLVAAVWLTFDVRQLRVRSDDTLPAVDFHRAQLQRQLEFARARRVGLRMLLIAPGPLLFSFAFAQAHPHLAPMMYVQMLTFVIIAIAAVPLSRRQRAAVQRKLDELERLA